MRFDIGGWVTGLQRRESEVVEMHNRVAAREASLERTLAEADLLKSAMVQFDTAYGGGNGVADEAARLAALDKSRRHFLGDPIVTQAERVWFEFIFGRGVSEPKLAEDYEKMLRDEMGLAEDADKPESAVKLEKLVMSCWSAPDSRNYLTGFDAQRRAHRRLARDGELPVLIFANSNKTDFAFGLLESREVCLAVEHPEKPDTPVAWCRKWKRNNGGEGVEWYWSAESIGQDWSKFLPKSVTPKDGVWLALFRSGAEACKMRGWPLFWSSLSWSNAANETVSNLRTWLRAKAMLAWDEKVPAGKEGSRQTTWATKLDGSNPTAPVGSAYIHNDQYGLEPIEISDAGSKMFETAILQCKLMAFAGVGLPAHYFADISQGNLATATAVELSVRKLFEAEQQWWTGMHDSLIQYVARLSGIDVNARRVIEIDFPTIVEKDAVVLLGALAQAVPGGVISAEDACRTAAYALGADDVEDWVERLMASAPDSQTATELDTLIQNAPEQAAPIVLKFARRVREGIAKRRAEASVGV